MGFRILLYALKFEHPLFISSHNDHIPIQLLSLKQAPQAPNNKKDPCHFINNEMDPKERKTKDRKKKYEFPIHSERSRAVAVAAHASMEQTPPEGHRSTHSVFPAANAYAVQPIGYPLPLTAPPANTHMDVDAHASTEGERRWGE